MPKPEALSIKRVSRGTGPVSSESGGQGGPGASTYGGLIFSMLLGALSASPLRCQEGRMNILLIEDDPRVAAFVAKSLKEEGHLVVHCADGTSGLQQASAERYDAIVLDRMLPGLDGLAVLEAIRGTGDATPVLMLSALGDTEERVRGLRAGSDDYLAKPFSVSELLARVEALGRRQAPENGALRLQVDNLSIDLAARLVNVDRKRVEVTNREFRILEYLARNPGRIVTRSILLEHVWDYSFDPQTNIIDQHVSRLRQKLVRAGAGSLIETVRGAGYSIGRTVS